MGAHRRIQENLTTTDSRPKACMPADAKWLGSAAVDNARHQF